MINDQAVSKGEDAFYHPELDVLRFCAFLLVYLFHALPRGLSTYLHFGIGRFAAAGLLGFVHGGAYGVDLFFALSSYLITELLLREYRSRGSIDHRAFYARRILRIWPLYFVALFVIPPIMHVVDPGKVLEKAWLVCFVFFVGNWACAWWGFPNSTIGSLWSVSVEEQFYIVWPLVMSRWIRYVRVIAVGLIICAFIARAWLIALNASYAGIWCNTFARMDPIAAGALLAACLNGKVPCFRPAVRVSLVGGGLLLLTLVGTYCSSDGKSFIAYPAASIASLLMIVGVLAPMRSSKPVRMVRILVYLGRISYGLYVFHSTAIDLTFVPSSSSTRWVLNLTSSFGLTVLLAAASYRWLESPFLRLKGRFSHVRSGPLPEEPAPTLAEAAVAIR